MRILPTKGLPGNTVFQALLIERAGSCVVSEAGTQTEPMTGGEGRKSHGICDRIKTEKLPIFTLYCVCEWDC